MKRTDRLPPVVPEQRSGAEPAGRPTAADARRNRLAALVERQGYCTIIDLSRELSVSDMTVRRDVRMLERQGVLRSVHGGVTMLPPAAMTGTDIHIRSARMSAAKRAIARRAVEFVPAGGAIALDSGTTTLELARLLPRRSPISVVTPSLSIVNALLGQENVDVTCLGGNLHSRSESFRGPATVAAIKELRFRMLFLAASGVRSDGVYSGSDVDAVTKRALVGAADEVILVTDSSKFGISAMVRACSLADVDRVIIDDGIAEDQRRALESHVPTVVVAPVEPDA